MVLKTNYHTHTPRCQHAAGSEEEYVLSAIEAGFDTLGFADHTPWNYKDYVSRIRMRADELEGYIKAVREQGERHKDRIRVLCGLECEYFPEYFPWIIEQKHALGLDYIIMGNHFDTTDEGGFYFGACTEKQHLHRYADMVIKGLETGEFMYLAHPDLYLAQYPVYDEDAKAVARELCRCVKALDIPLEYNVLGTLYSDKGRFRGLGYPAHAFWETAAEEGAKCVIGVDAHDPSHLRNIEGFEKSVKYLDSLHMERLERLI